NYAQLARGDQLDALPGFDRRSLINRQGRVFRPLLADGDERSRFSESVNVCNRPAQFFFESLDGGGGGWRAGGENSNSYRCVPTEFIQALRCVIITPFGREVVPLV